MDILVLFDSTYGNTEKVARAVASGSSSKNKVDVIHVSDAASDGIKVTAFDTGIRVEDLNFALKILTKIIGYAAPTMCKSLQDKGGTPATLSMDFYVKGKEWAKTIISSPALRRTRRS